jgi:phosphatidylinositol-3-phosphatase
MKISIPMRRLGRWLGAAVCGLALASCSGGGGSGSSSSTASTTSSGSTQNNSSGTSTSSSTLASKIGHVFIIVLENENYSATFSGSGSQAPYLATTLPAQGALLTQYYGTGHNSNDNYLSMISGQAPNVQTQEDCLLYSDWVGTTQPDSDGQVIGTGCVYPSAIQTVANQLEDAGLNWRGYMEDMGNDLSRDGSATCSHPTLDSPDGTQTATATDGYATRHDPFMYFHAIIDNAADCNAHVVNYSNLQSDLKSVATTPQLSFITPNLCDDGHDNPTCVNEGGKAGGLPAINTYLQSAVPMITSSPAFQKDGLLIITFDESSTSDQSECCSEPTGPNTITPGLTGPGGGRIGAVLLSPFIKPGTVSNTPYNHYATLRSIEDIFGLSYLGYAGASGLQSFGSDVFTALPASN